MQRAVTAPRRSCASVLSALLMLVPGAAFADAEHELEGRLFAPCCWTQTLDIHDSPLADSLRKEIHERLHAGELSTKVEADLVQRYGPKILAVPSGRDPRQEIVWITLSAMALVLVGLFVAARRWARGSATSMVHATAATSAVGTAPDAIDAQLDAELDKLRD